MLPLAFAQSFYGGTAMLCTYGTVDNVLYT